MMNWVRPVGLTAQLDRSIQTAKSAPYLVRMIILARLISQLLLIPLSWSHSLAKAVFNLWVFITLQRVMTEHLTSPRILSRLRLGACGHT